MKIKEKVSEHDGKLIVEKQYDNTAYLDRAKQLRDSGIGVSADKEKWLVGTVPMHMLEQWMKDENVAWDDAAGRQRVILKYLNDPNFKKLRVKEGRI